MKNKQKTSLKHRIVNILMFDGNKKTGEKILLKSIKLLQKLTSKKHTSLVQTAIMNSTPTFKINHQAVKKGKRKSIKEIPTFIINDSLRTMSSLKFIKTSSSKLQSSTCFYKTFTKEIFLASQLKSNSVEKKTELQKQILINKRYLSKFRWS